MCPRLCILRRDCTFPRPRSDSSTSKGWMAQLLAIRHHHPVLCLCVPRCCLCTSLCTRALFLPADYTEFAICAIPTASVFTIRTMFCVQAAQKDAVVPPMPLATPAPAPSFLKTKPEAAKSGSQPTTPVHSTPATSQTLKTASPSGQDSGCNSPAAGARPTGGSGRLLRTSISSLGVTSDLISTTC